MTWIFLSKDLEDPYINMFAASAGAQPVDKVDYGSSQDPIVMRGILKHKLMKQCWADGRDFYYMDTGYVGNAPKHDNPNGRKQWHRIVKNNLQHGDIVKRPPDRWKQLGVKLLPRRYGRTIIIAAPDDKPCKFYGIDQKEWVEQTISTIKQHTDRPIVVRQRAPRIIDRVMNDPLSRVLMDDVHALVTFNSNAATESIMLGVPAFVLAPCHAAAPVANTNLTQIENPYWADPERLQDWCNHLAYGQFHVKEIKNGTAYRMLNAR